MMAWFKDLFSKKHNKRPVEMEKKAGAPASAKKERYTYSVGGVSSTDPWIFIICNEADATRDSEPFTELVKKVARIMNDGVWEGNILPAGIFQGNTRYRIKNDPTLMVFQYDTLLGIVLEYTPGIGLGGTLNYLSNILGITVDDKYRQAASANKVPSAPQVKVSTNVGTTNTPKEQKATTVLIIPEGTKEIKRSEYEKQHNIRQVVLPEGLETIGDSAFYGCVNLEKINIPRSVKKMGQQVFCGCEKLTSAGPYTSNCSIEFDASNVIVENLFFNCKYLKCVHLPEGISCIGKGAFEFCESIKEISIPESVTDIQADAFAFCKNLQKISLPDGVINIDAGAFRGCNQLADANGFIIIRSVLYGCLNLKDTIVIPQGITAIDSDAFVLGTSISNDVTTTIIIPESVVRISHHRAFLQCKKLETVIISESASDEVKQVAKIIADRTEERRKDQNKPKPVYIRTPEQLWIFRSANKEIMDEEVYQAIISKFQEIRDKVMGKGGETDVRWSESATMISLYDKDSHWVGHDDTVTESIELKLEHLSKWEEPSDWTSASDLPCEGAYQYLNESQNKGNNWSYSIMSHKAWLLKAPFGLPGVWRFEYISKDYR